MKENKSKKTQINAILNVFNNQKNANIQFLMDRCEIGERQLKEYLKDIREEGYMEIEYNHKTKEYERKGELKGNIAAVFLTNSELISLKTAVKLLEQFTELPQLKDLSGLFEKLKNNVDFRTKTTSKETIEFENIPTTKGNEFITEIWEYIDQEKVIEFQYQKFGGGEEKRTLHPYLLKEHKNRWYILGMDNAKKKLRQFGLDRMKNIVPTWDKYEKNTTNLKKLYYHSFGIYFNFEQKEEAIVLHFSPKRAEYLHTQPFHPQQLEKNRILQNDSNGLRIKFDLRIDDELLMELARLGKDVKIISPFNLIDKLKDYLKTTLTQYPS